MYMYIMCFVKNINLRIYCIYVTEPHLETSVERRISTESASDSENEIFIFTGIGIPTFLIIIGCFIYLCKSNKVS